MRKHTCVCASSRVVLAPCAAHHDNFPLLAITVLQFTMQFVFMDDLLVHTRITKICRIIHFQFRDLGVCSLTRRLLVLTVRCLSIVAYICICVCDMVQRLVCKAFDGPFSTPMSPCGRRSHALPFRDHSCAAYPRMCLQPRQRVAARWSHSVR